MTTEYTQQEPMGFGHSPFGDPSTDSNEIEYGRGFGDPETQYTTDNES